MTNFSQDYQTTCDKDRGNIDAILAQYLSVEQAAEALRVHRRTLERWYAMRRGPPRVLIGQRVFYPIDGIKAWIAKNTESF